MTITQEQHARIRQLYFGEHWKVGTIVAELGLHPDAVTRALETPRFGNRVDARRPSILDPYKPLVVTTLEKHPRLRSSRLHQMLQARGYNGGAATVRRYVREVRPGSGKREAFLTLQTLPGEQGQVDWAHFGKLRIGAAQRPLMLFVMVLGFSRAIFARFFLDQRTDNFLRGHVYAFTHFGGVPRELLFDNLKSVVVERVGSHVRFSSQILELASHYCFAPKPCAPYRGNEKGKVERAIQYVRTSFFAARGYRDLDDLNAQLARWCAEASDGRRHPSDKDHRTVLQCLEYERPYLLPLPQHAFECDVVQPIRSGKRPHIRFEQNDYSIPHALTRKPLTLVISERRLRVLNGAERVAEHVRSYDRGQYIEDPGHRTELIEHKRRARELTGRGRVITSCQSADKFYEQLVIRGAHLGGATARLLKLLEQYGPRMLDAAIGEALQRDAIGPAAVAHICERMQRSRGAKPPLPPIDSTDPRIANTHVRPHDLADYDLLRSDAGKRSES
jgi:transposase